LHPIFTKFDAFVGNWVMIRDAIFNVQSKADMSQLNLPHGSLIYHTMHASIKTFEHTESRFKFTGEIATDAHEIELISGLSPFAYRTQLNGELRTIRYDTIRDAILTCARKPT